ncbi:Uncharacterised protein g3641 [Pycnogonum litorale]
MKQAQNANKSNLNEQIQNKSCCLYHLEINNNNAVVSLHLQFTLNYRGQFDASKLNLPYTASGPRNVNFIRKEETTTETTAMFLLDCLQYVQLDSTFIIHDDIISAHYAMKVAKFLSSKNKFVTTLRLKGTMPEEIFWSKAASVGFSKFFVVICHTDVYLKIIRAAAAHLLLSKSVWLILGPQRLFHIEKISRITLKTDSRIIIGYGIRHIHAVEEENQVNRRRMIILRSLYHDHTRNFTNSRVLGNWTTKGGLLAKKSSTDCCYDLTSANVRVIVQHEPFTDISTENGEVKLNGFLGKVWTLLETIFKFRTTFIITKDNTWGAKQPDGNWSGLIGDLQKRKADIALSTFTMTLDRSEVVDFSSYYFLDRNAIMYRRKDQNIIAGFTNPFHWSVWLLVLFTYLVVFFLLKWNTWKSDKFPVYRSDSRILDRELFSFEVVFGMLTCQSLCREPVNILNRIIILFYWLFCVLVSMFYGSILISFLTVTRNDVPFHDLQSFIKHPEYRPVMNKGYYLEETIKGAVDPVYYEMWNRMKEHEQNHFVQSLQEGINLAYTEKVGYINDANIISAIVHRNCSFKMLKFGSLNSLHLAFKKNSQYTSSISSQLSKLVSNGILERALREFVPTGCVNDDLYIRQLYIEDMMMPFICSMVGIFISVCLLLAENIFKKLRKPKQTHDIGY